MMKKEEDEH